MKAPIRLFSLLAAVTISAASISMTASAAGPAKEFPAKEINNQKNQIAASFTRMLNHEPAATNAITGDPIQSDELYFTINRPLWSSAITRDPALASFERAFNHQPVTGASVAADTRDILTGQFQATLWSTRPVPRQNPKVAYAGEAQ